MIRLLVASGNPSKVEGARKAAERFFGNAVADGIATESGVRDTPIGIGEIMKGLENRLSGITEHDGYGMYVALEAGIVGDMLVTFSLIHLHGRKWAGMSPGYMLPRWIVERVKEGESLAEIAEQVSGTKDIRSRHGLVGFLSGERWKREDLNRMAVEMAIVSSFWERHDG